MEVFGDVRNLLRGGLVTVGKMATVGNIKTHDTVANLKDSRVSVEVSGGTRKRLNVNTPLLRSQIKSLESTLLTEALGLINELVTTVVTVTRVALRVLVLHLRAEHIHDGPGSEVLGRNQGDRLLLAPPFALNNGVKLLVSLLNGAADQLGRVC